MTFLHPITTDAGQPVQSTRARQDEVAREILAQFGDKWSLQIIRALADRPARFTELRRAVSQARPISSRILVLTLRHLERNGLVSREIFAVVPPRVEYSLTPLGAQFLDLGARLLNWVSASQTAFRSAHARFDGQQAVS